jgi:hypothetical protein
LIANGIFANGIFADRRGGSGDRLRATAARRSGLSFPDCGELSKAPRSEPLTILSCEVNRRGALYAVSWFYGSRLDRVPLNNPEHQQVQLTRPPEPGYFVK